MLETLRQHLAAGLQRLSVRKFSMEPFPEIGPIQTKRTIE